MKRRQRKVKMFKAFVMALLIVSTIVSLNVLSNGDRGKYADYDEVYVKHGDTLWDIAREYYGDSIDLREGVYAIIECSALESENIYFGQKLLVPKF